jgi:putative flippase GtrA
MLERILNKPDIMADRRSSPIAREPGMTAVRPVVLIPAYQPDALLMPLVEKLSASGDLAGILLVDDGGGPKYRELFRSLARLDGVTVLTHVVNLGKGAALKTGMNHAAVCFPKSVGVVTADADGQHSAADILKVAKQLASTPGHLVMGAREFDATVPFRSRFGNTLTRYIMRAVTGQKLGDTQSGLRGIPLQFIPQILKLRATGYDFELDMLVLCKDTGRPIREVPIATIYIENNRSSHFNPLRDSMRIYFVFIRFIAASLATAAIDNGVFVLGMHFWPNLLLCQAAGRLVAGMFQFTVGRQGVFHSKARVASALPKYWILVLCSGALSYLLIQGFLRFTSLGVIPAKLLAETLLFFISFVVQRDVVFARPAASVENGNPE